MAGVELINRHFGEVVAVAKNAIGIQTQFLGDSRDLAGRKTEGKARPRQTQAAIVNTCAGPWRQIRNGFR
jgi:hypothetical protein